MGMKIYTTMVFIRRGRNTKLGKCDTIEHEGKLWLVPEWLEVPSAEVKTPKRMVCIADLQYQVLKPGAPYGDFLLKESMPKDVLDGKTTKHGDKHYLVVEYPGLSDIPAASDRIQ